MANQQSALKLVEVKVLILAVPCLYSMCLVKNKSDKSKGQVYLHTMLPIDLNILHNRAVEILHSMSNLKMLTDAKYG